MRELFGYLILMVVISTYHINAKRVRQCCTSKDTSEYCEFLELSCPLGYVIYSPDVYPTSQSCKIGHYCHGVNIPYTNLRVDILNCHWKNKCQINPESINRSYPSPLRPENCSLGDWKNLMVKGWKCVLNASITDICADTKVHEIHISNHLNQTSGLIRSHEHFPWEYNKDVFLLGNNQYAQKCTVTFNGYMQQEKDFSRIAVYVHALDVADDYNSAHIKDVELVEKKTYVYNFTDGPVNITFGLDVTDQRMKGGAGFVIYYKYHQYVCPIGKLCDSRKLKLFVPSDDPENVCTYVSIRKPGRPRKCRMQNKFETCKKVLQKGRKQSMIIYGNSTEKFSTCKWMMKAKGRGWSATYVSNISGDRSESLTVKYYQCKKSPTTESVLEPQITPYILSDGDIITVEYTRNRVGEDSLTWSPENTEFKMIFKRSRQGNG
ncbi:uncharacterized protein [Argopecten irradians]|uniref:uncharacterized protein isoform X2 n=1 Tax=Argopecten irradians TaxID=31199 RepID=UPI00371ABD42